MGPLRKAYVVRCSFQVPVVQYHLDCSGCPPHNNCHQHALQTALNAQDAYVGETGVHTEAAEAALHEGANPGDQGHDEHEEE